jgi:hypothetical protein
MMKISALYFLNYPNKPPENPEIACSELRVEVGESNPTIEAFDHTFAFTVYTIGFLENELRSKGRLFIIDRAAIIVSTFDVAVIRKAVESVLNELDQYGMRLE